ncbi:MAG: hypothetical protein LH614_03075 [Pyrinomonadaceae bacterium]|nr:hypothetical protein [Pyrinomonadaceae bacterium]
MNKVSFKITLIVLTFLFIFSACKKSDNSDDFDTLFFSDDTTAAAELVADANEDLNKIKIMYKRNEVQLEELKAAMGDRDIEKVKKIADELVYVINDGMALGEKAVEKINRAEQMNINADFKEYLSLKEESLQKQLEAFENRRQAALLLRDVFGTANPAAIEKAKLGFKEKEEKFMKTLETSREINKKANELAKESAKKGKE